MTDKKKINEIESIINEILEKTNFEHIENNTSIFMNTTSEKMDKKTVELIKTKFKIWVDSWINQELDEVKRIIKG